MRSPPPECTAPLIDALKRESEFPIKATMLSALARAPASPEIVPTALEIIKSAKSELSRVSAVITLGSVGPPAAERAVPVLVTALDDPDCGQEAVRQLGRIGSLARTAAPELISALTNRSRPWLLRRHRRCARGDRRAAETALPALVAAIGIGSDVDDDRCAAAVGHYGASAALAVPALKRLLETSGGSDRIYARASAATSLGRIGQPAASAVPSLIRALKDEHPQVRIAAAGSFQGIGPAARAALPSLIAALDDPDNVVGLSAVESLGAVATNETIVVDALRRKLDHATLGRPAEAALIKIGARGKVPHAR